MNGKNLKDWNVLNVVGHKQKNLCLYLITGSVINVGIDGTQTLRMKRSMRKNEIHGI